LGTGFRFPHHRVGVKIPRANDAPGCHWWTIRQ
jgi:hypothetical protein